MCVLCHGRHSPEPHACLTASIRPSLPATTYFGNEIHEIISRKRLPLSSSHDRAPVQPRAGSGHPGAAAGSCVPQTWSDDQKPKARARMYGLLSRQATRQRCMRFGICTLFSSVGVMVQGARKDNTPRCSGRTCPTFCHAGGLHQPATYTLCWISILRKPMSLQRDRGTCSQCVPGHPRMLSRRFEIGTRPESSHGAGLPPGPQLAPVCARLLSIVAW